MSCVRPFIALAVLSLVSCTSPQEELPTITIGAVLDQSGSIAAPSWKDSAEVARDHLNAALETIEAGFRFEVLVFDSGANADTTVERATSLVNDEGAIGLVTDLSRSSINTNKLNYDADESARLNVPGICILCTSTEINDPLVEKDDAIEQAALRDEDGWWFRTSTKQNLIADVLFRTIFAAGPDGDGDVNDDDHFRVGLYVNDDNPGHDFRAQINTILGEDKPGSELEAVFVVPNLDVNEHQWDDDLAALLDNANDDTETSPGDKTDTFPDVVFESVTASYAISMIKEYAAIGSTIPFFHFHGFRHPLVQFTLGPDINGQEGVSHAILDNGDSGEVFAAALEAVNGIGPQYLDSHVYDSVVILGLAAVAAASDLEDPTEVTGEQVRDAIPMIQEGSDDIQTGSSEFAAAMELLQAGTSIDYLGASGPVDFDEYGNALGKLVHYKGVDGEWQDLETYDCVQEGCPPVE